MSNQLFSKIAKLWNWKRNGMGTVSRLKKVTTFSKSDQILDIGGGSGSVARVLRPLVSNVTVLDPAEGMVNICNEQGGDIKGVLGYAEKIPFLDNSFDKVLLIDALHHVGLGQSQAVKEIHRVLKINGEVVIEEFNPKKIIGWVIMVFEKLLRLGSIFHTPVSLAQMFGDSGFTVNQYENDSWRYYFVCRKI